MSGIKIHVLHTGKVCVSPDLPFGGEDCSAIRASGIFGRKEDRLWLPVSVYLVEIDDKKILFDTGWHREMSPDGVVDKKAQIKSLGSKALYLTNQGVVEKGAAVDEQLAAMGVKPSDLDYVLLSHLDCDHANGLKLVSDARRILVSQTEIEFASGGSPVTRIRYQSKWWDGTRMEGFDWNGTEGPAGRSYDVLGDGRLKMINIPGHCDGQCALKITGADGRFVLLFADGGYARRSWEEMVTSGISADKEAQKRSLQWIREQSLDPACVESLANHDPDVRPHVIDL